MTPPVAISRFRHHEHGGFNDHCDWRLPTLLELQTILIALNPCPTSTCIDPIFGPTAAFYWSSTTDADHPGTALGVDFTSGRGLAGTFKTFSSSVRAVRGGS